MHIDYTPQGTCSKQILIDINDADQTIEDVTFIGGCPGNTLGISSLTRGLKVNDVIRKLDGIRCGMKSTSCPDQLAQALKAALRQAGTTSHIPNHSMS